VESPHPYEKLGANYRGKSPYYLRQSVLTALIQAQIYLQQQYSGWRIKIFDAYRPLEVQRFMVNYTFSLVVQKQGSIVEQLSLEQRQDIWKQVYQIWAIPSSNSATPPPHSTGAAIDITLVDEQGKTIYMGGEIDELSPRSQPYYYANSTNKKEKEYHQKRELLNEIMEASGFRRHPGEWWHFSLGDQMWTWLSNQESPDQFVIARYGRVED
ncbi:MAG: M15 family metallopeptidase, partial [Microcystaceae cyanobacterium]